MRNKKMFVLKIVWRKSIASLYRLTQAMQLANQDARWGTLPEFCTPGIMKPHEIITFFFLSLCLFLSVCFHAVKGISLEPN